MEGTITVANSTATYAWNTGETTASINVTPTTNTTYTVTATDGNCTTTDDVAVTVTPNPTVNLGNDVAICSGDSTLLDAGSGHTNYLWNTVETTQSIYANASGLYSVTVGNGTPSNVGSSLSFNGTSSTVNVSNNSVTGSNGFVVSFDFYASNLPVDDSGDPNYTIVDQGSGGQWGIQYAEENGTLRFQVKTGNWSSVEIPIVENTWYRIVAQYDKANNSIDFYKDGLFVDGMGVSGTLTSF